MSSSTINNMSFAYLPVHQTRGRSVVYVPHVVPGIHITYPFRYAMLNHLVHTP